LQRLKREEDFRLRQRLKRIRSNLKHIAHYFLAFSLFIIINACVGLSSAPFYITHVKCKLVEPSQDCLSLKSLSTGTYISEMLGGFFLAFQSSLIYYFLDNYGSSSSSGSSNMCSLLSIS
jgi:hypothetical protein